MSSSLKFRYYFKKPDNKEWSNWHSPFKRLKRCTDEGVAVNITSTELPGILGYGYGGESAGKMYDYMKGVKEPQDISNLPHIKFGFDNEAVALADFYKKQPGYCGAKPGTLADSEHSWLLATADQIMLDPKTKLLMPLEIKTTQNELPLPTELKSRHIWQCLIQQRVLGPWVTHSLLHYWNPAESVTFILPRNDTLIDFAIKKGLEFQEALRLNRRPDRVRKDKQINSLLDFYKSQIKILN